MMTSGVNRASRPYEERVTPVHGTFKVWDARIPAERADWANLWRQWPDKEVSVHPGYGELFAGAEDAVKCASYVGSDGSTVMFPFIERNPTIGLKTKNWQRKRIYICHENNNKKLQNLLNKNRKKMRKVGCKSF